MKIFLDNNSHGFETPGKRSPYGLFRIAENHLKMSVHKSNALSRQVLL